MKVAFITDYPLIIESKESFSGAEVSITILAHRLNNSGVNVKVISPTQKSYLPSRLTSSPFWYLYSAAIITKELVNFKPDVIHVHGKNVLIGTFLANLFIRKPFIATVRDYRLICDLGMCLLVGNKVCSLGQYLFKDIPKFVRQYKSGQKIDYVYAYLVGIYQMFLRPINIAILKNINEVVCLSRAQEEIYKSVGVNNTMVIYNPVVFTPEQKKKKQIFFGGRYTLGKGKEILDGVLPNFTKSFPDWKIIRVGKNSQIGQVSYTSYLKMVGESAFALVPSVWPEPFGRAALDALAMGTPVITTNRGGLPEIVENDKYGLVVNANPADFLKAMVLGVKNYSRWVKEIVKNKNRLTNKFTIEPVDKYISLYNQVVKQ